jgi:hypothetical protein
MISDWASMRTFSKNLGASEVGQTDDTPVSIEFIIHCSDVHC